MASKIAPFCLRAPEICVKCGEDMPAGTVATWLRSPNEKGYYHPMHESMMTNPQLVRVKVPDDSPLKYSWMRVCDIQNKSVDTEKLPSGHKTETEVKHAPIFPVVTVAPGAKGLMEKGVASVRPELGAPAVSPNDILLNALVQALLPSLTERIAAAVANDQPRIIVQVFVPKEGDEVKALDVLSRELFKLVGVNQI
jgi:hypothetical protein